MGSPNVQKLVTARDRLVKQVGEAEAELSSAKASYHQANFQGQRETALDRIRLADRRLGELKESLRTNEDRLEQARSTEQQDQLERQEKMLTFQSVKQESPKSRDEAAKNLSRVLTLSGIALLTGLVSSGVLKGDLGSEVVPHALNAVKVLLLEVAVGFAFPLVKFLVEDAHYRKSRDSPEDIGEWAKGHKSRSRKDINALWVFFVIQAALLVFAVYLVWVALGHVTPSADAVLAPLVQ